MSAVRKFEENVGRFKELVLYISQKSANDPKFDTLKLNKLMFFADFWTYGVCGEPITGFEYQKLQRGPAPKRMPEMRSEMVKDRVLGLQELPLRPWKRTVNLRTPNLGVFTAQQISIVDYIIESLRDFDGDGASMISHQMPCWIVPNLNEAIPYEMVFLSTEKPTETDIERGKAVAVELGLLEHQTA